MKRIGFQNSPVKSLCAMVFGRFIDAPNALRTVTVRKSQVSLVRRAGYREGVSWLRRINNLFGIEVVNTVIQIGFGK
jgi:hypothetical protein